MDIQHIKQLLTDLELDSEPAFEDTKYVIVEPPSLGDRTLGCYFPRENLIAISPTAEERVVLHELGHRHSDFYYHDLSEKAAESFRKVYQGNYSPYEVPSLPLYLLDGIMGAIVGFGLTKRKKSRR